MPEKLDSVIDAFIKQYIQDHPNRNRHEYIIAISEEMEKNFGPKYGSKQIHDR